VCPHTLRGGAAIGLWAPSGFHGCGRVMGGRLWRGTYKIRRSRMRKRYVQALDLSVGFSDFGGRHGAFSCVGGRVWV